MRLPLLLPVLYVLGISSVGGCVPDLGRCDEALARTVVYSDDDQGLPAYAGQALIDGSCGNGAFCHSAYSEGGLRYGVPAGLDFDMALATDAEQTAVLQRGQRNVYDFRYSIYRLVDRGHMPPGETGAEVLGASRTYAGLPAIGSRDGLRILRNWLACGSPVVERTTPRPPDLPAVGAVVPPLAVPACADALVACGARCVDVTTDSGNCGRCGNVCPTGASCVAGECQCAGGLTACPSGCIDTTSSVLDCGSCDWPCGTGQVCYSSMCSTGGCPQGTTNCSGSCVLTETNVAHCGACDHACPGGASCIGGQCVCSGGATLCGGACTTVSSDPSNCGSCGNVCPVGASCSSGSCTCSGGLTACADGCADLATSPSDCGRCGNACDAGQSCRSGSCQSVSFSSDVEPILTGGCLGSNCHSGTRPAEGLSLEMGKAYAELVNVSSNQCASRMLVQPGSVDSSYLVDKLLGVSLCRGGPMPKTGGPLSSAQLDTIRAWIAAGAPNN